MKEESKTQIKLVIRVFVVALILVWAACVLTDFIRTKNEKEPVFCITKHTYKYDDGKTNECIGLGYKVYDYNRKSIKAKEFGPIFIKQRTDIKGLK